MTKQGMTLCGSQRILDWAHTQILWCLMQDGQRWLGWLQTWRVLDNCACKQTAVNTSSSNCFIRWLFFQSTGMLRQSSICRWFSHADLYLLKNVPQLSTGGLWGVGWPREVDFLDHHSTNHAESHHAPLPLLWHGTGDVEMVSGFTFIIATCFGVVISWPQWWVESRVSVKIHNFSWFVSVKCRPLPIFSWASTLHVLWVRGPVGQLVLHSFPALSYFILMYVLPIIFGQDSMFDAWNQVCFFFNVGPHELVNFPLRRTSPFFLVNIPLFYPFFKCLFDGSEKNVDLRPIQLEMVVNRLKNLKNSFFSSSWKMAQTGRA